MTGHLEPPSSDDAMPAHDDDVPHEGLAIKSAPASEEDSDTPQVAPLGEPIIVWKTYGLTVPLSLYNDSDQVRDVLNYKMREAKSQQTSAKLCTFSKHKKDVTYAEAYEDKSFRQWYLGRLHGPKSSLNSGQTEFARYCAEREELEWKFFQDFFPVGQKRLSQKAQSPLQSQIEVLRKTKVKSKNRTVPPNSERASSSNEPSHPAANRIAFLTGFNRHNATASAAARSSKDDASLSSFSLVDEQ